MERAKQAVPWFGIEQVRGENIYQKKIFNWFVKNIFALYLS